MANTPVDLVITDRKMPRVSGIDRKTLREKLQRFGLNDGADGPLSTAYRLMAIAAAPSKAARSFLMMCSGVISTSGDRRPLWR